MQMLLDTIYLGLFSINNVNSASNTPDCSSAEPVLKKRKKIWWLENRSTNWDAEIWRIFENFSHVSSKNNNFEKRLFFSKKTRSKNWNLSETAGYAEFQKSKIRIRKFHKFSFTKLEVKKFHFSELKFSAFLICSYVDIFQMILIKKSRALKYFRSWFSNTDFMVITDYVNYILLF